MRLGISALFQASGGSLTNLAQLLRAWDAGGALARHEVILFTSPRVAERLRDKIGEETLQKTTIVPFPRSDRGLAGRLLDEQWRLPHAVEEHHIDVLFCPGNVVPLRARVPVVATFQNAAPFCESVTLSTAGLRHWLQFRMLGRFMRMSARRATRVIFLSEWFRDMFAQRFGFDRNRGRVVRRAGHDPLPEDRALEERLGIRRPYVISVSHLNPYKQTVELLEGFARASRDVPGRQLVLVGMAQFPAYRERIRETIEEFALQDSVILTGELSHRDALTLMAGSESFVFTSTCEAGPTALIEALALGLPIGSSNVGTMPEVTGDAALLFDPRDPDAVAAALRKLMGDAALREQLRQRAHERARFHLGAADVAAATLAVLEEAAG
jgi:glycosyltransferase involved in cell wall biosynthesis